MPNPLLKDNNPRNGDTPSPLFVASVDKAMRVLKSFYGTDKGLSLREISQMAELDKSAAQRFTFTLRHLGYLRQDPNTRRYHLTAQFLDLAYGYLYAHPLVRKATPYLIACQARCEETVNLTERVGGDIIYLARFPSRRVITVEVFVGMRLPAYCTAPGRAMLAFAPAEEVDEVLAGSKLVKHTAFTINDPASIRAELQRIRTNGYAVVQQETYLGDLSIAAPILDESRRAVGAVNIAVPLSRWPSERAQRELAPMVMQTASAIVDPMTGWAGAS